jgi:hypothetical protein
MNSWIPKEILPGCGLNSSANRLLWIYLSFCQTIPWVHQCVISVNDLSHEVLWSLDAWRRNLNGSPVNCQSQELKGTSSYVSKKQDSEEEI